MTPAPVPSLFRVTLALLAVLGATLPDAHAAGRNHDLQAIQIPAALPAFHDYAPGPSVH